MGRRLNTRNRWLLVLLIILMPIAGIPIALYYWLTGEFDPQK